MLMPQSDCLEFDLEGGGDDKIRTTLADRLNSPGTQDHSLWGPVGRQPLLGLEMLLGRHPQEEEQGAD